MNHPGRIRRLQDALSTDALYVSNLSNVRYLCGFTGSNGSLLMGHDDAWFLTDGRYRTQSADEVVGADVEVYALPDQLGASLERLAGKLGARRIGFEADHVAVAAADRLRAYLPDAELVPTSGLVEGLRRVKEPDELARIREAARLADEGLAYILERVEAGRTERELAIMLESHLRLAGAEAVSFPSIVAAAERSALPHAHPTERTVEEGRFLLFDLGCVFEGYCSDMTRTVVVGHADDRHREIYELVAAAQQAGLDALAPGRTGAEVDRGAGRDRRRRPRRCLRPQPRPRRRPRDPRGTDAAVDQQRRPRAGPRRHRRTGYLSSWLGRRAHRGPDRCDRRRCGDAQPLPQGPGRALMAANRRES